MPKEYSAELAKRLIAGRKKVSLDRPEMAAKLSRYLGRTVSSDTYRKWESSDATIHVDAILAFCDITGVDVKELLGKNLSDGDL
jgi:hypothetical protein